MTVLPVTAVFAQEAMQTDRKCGDDLDCEVGVPVGWGGGVEGMLLLGNPGGQISDATNRVRIDFESGNVSDSFIVHYASTYSHTVALETPNIGLGAFLLTSETEGAGTTHDFKIGWRLQFDYADCNPGEPCMDAIFDETSMTCMHLDATSNAWVALASHVNVLSNRLDCSSTDLGEFVIVAQPLRTSGAGDIRSFLPVITGW